MPNSNTGGIITGLVFVTVFLMLLATFGQMSKVVQGPFAAPSPDGYELAGSSRPVKLPE
jgi:Na+-transporting methylmalonyl-CoA/oxaloacetate decarboxylase gamma subunit